MIDRQLIVPQLIYDDISRFFTNIDAINLQIDNNNKLYGGIKFYKKFEFDPELLISVPKNIVQHNERLIPILNIQPIRDYLMNEYNKLKDKFDKYCRENVKIFYIKKRNGGKRWIWNPQNDYREKLKKIKRILYFPAKACALDYAVRGLPHLINAWRFFIKTNKDLDNYILIKYDLENHYERLKPWQVAVSFFRAYKLNLSLSFSEFKSRYISKLRDIITNMCLCAPEGRCRQGFPTSPFISALGLLNYDKILSSKFVFYSRYVDDIICIAFPSEDIKKLVDYIFLLTRWFGQRVNRDKIRIFRLGKEHKYIDHLGLRFFINGRVRIKNKEKYEELYEEAIKNNYVSKAAGYKGWLNITKVKVAS